MHPSRKRMSFRQVVIDRKCNSEYVVEEWSSDCRLCLCDEVYKWGLYQKDLLLLTAPFFITVPYINNNDVANILDLQMVTCSNWYFLKMLHYLIRYVNSLLRAHIFPHIKIQRECKRQKWWIILHILLIYPTEGSSWRSEARKKEVSSFIPWLPPCGVIFSRSSTKAKPLSIWLLSLGLLK